MGGLYQSGGGSGLKAGTNRPPQLSATGRSENPLGAFGRCREANGKARHSYPKRRFESTDYRR